MDHFWILLVFALGSSTLADDVRAPPVTTVAPLSEECGLRKENFRVKHLATWREAGMGQYPWIVTLRYQYRDNQSHLVDRCGGALITRQHVLTAAHCVRDVETIFVLKGVVAGDYNTSSERDCVVLEGKEICSTPVFVPVTDIITPAPPRRYQRRTLKNDIAVLRLEYKLPITDFIRPICLPSGEQQLASGDSVSVVGWGRNLKNSTLPKDVLLDADVNVKDFDECARLFNVTDRVVYSPQMFCAGQGIVNPCRGDSGGPLMLQSDGRFYVMGVVSSGFGDDCGGYNEHGIYTNVTNYLDFIEESVNKTTANVAPRDDECGTRKINHKIPAGMEEVDVGQYPWIVALRYQGNDNQSDVRNLCSGSLITRQHVITTAHCVNDINDRTTRTVYMLMGVVAGLRNTSADRDCTMIGENETSTTAVYVPKNTVIIPSSFSKTSTKNDIAVIKLQYKLPITDFIRPICLPSGNQQLAPGNSVLIAGWGRTIRSPLPRAVLTHAYLNVKRLEVCSWALRWKSRNFYSPQMMCAGRRNIDTCHSSNGGPLMRQVDGRFYVMGVTTFGLKSFCGLKGVPGYYTNVTNYLDFIENSINTSEG